MSGENFGAQELQILDFMVLDFWFGVFRVHEYIMGVGGSSNHL